MSILSDNLSRSFYSFTQGVDFLEEVLSSSPLDWKVVDGRLERTHLTTLQKIIIITTDIFRYYLSKLIEERSQILEERISDQRRVRLEHISTIFESLAPTIEAVNEDWGTLKDQITERNASHLLPYLEKMGKIVSWGYFASDIDRYSAYISMKCRLSWFPLSWFAGIYVDDFFGHDFFYRGPNEGIFKLSEDLRWSSVSCYALENKAKRIRDFFILKDPLSAYKKLFNETPHLFDAITDKDPKNYLLNANIYRIIWNENHTNFTPPDLVPLLNHIRERYAFFNAVIEERAIELSESEEDLRRANFIPMFGDYSMDPFARYTIKNPPSLEPFLHRPIRWLSNVVNFFYDRLQ